LRICNSKKKKKTGADYIPQYVRRKNLKQMPTQRPNPKGKFQNKLTEDKTDNNKCVRLAFVNTTAWIGLWKRSKSFANQRLGGLVVLRAKRLQKTKAKIQRQISRYGIEFTVSYRRRKENGKTNGEVQCQTGTIRRK
jgi:hypothetical protein